MDKIYPSKRGFVVWLPLIILVIIEVVYIISKQYVAGLLSLAIVSLAIVPMIVNTRYTITADGSLRIRCGIFLNITVAIENIKKVQATKTILSAPALSLDRIEVFYNKFDSVVISPVNKEIFIADLQAVNPAITYQK